MGKKLPLLFLLAQVPVVAAEVAQQKDAVVKVEVVGANLNINWIDQSWATWELLQRSAELRTITEKAKKRLADSKARISKGAGKGPQ